MQTSSISSRCGASINHKLRETARSTGQDPDFLRKKFVAERFLARLADSAHKDIYVLKGGMRMLAANPKMARATDDIDLSCVSLCSKETWMDHMNDVASVIPEKNDGIEFILDEKKYLGETMRREYAGNPGIRIYVDARMRHCSGVAHTRLKLDISHEKAITPHAVLAKMTPTLQGWTSPDVLSYPWETVLAEKLHAIVLQGEANTRMRDFYDILSITRSLSMSGDVLLKALAATFAARQSAELTPDPAGLRGAFADAKSSEWAAFTQKSGVPMKMDDFHGVVNEVAAYAKPLLSSASLGETFSMDWVAGKGWLAV